MGRGHSIVLLLKFALLHFLSVWSSDYANYYQGLWDCSADEPDELSFQRGDLIYIISKVGINIGQLFKRLSGQTWRSLSREPFPDSTRDLLT